MTKSILLTFAFALFALTTFNVSAANACATCGCADKAAHHHGHDHAKKKPCTKCAEAKAHYDKKKKPCTKCVEAKAYYNKKSSSSSIDHSEKGSLTVRGNYGKTGGTASYND